LNTRSYFDNAGYHIHGHPSSGGILIKHLAKIVGLEHLSLPRLANSQRSEDAKEEDEFCERMRRVGASWWKHEAEFLRAYYGKDDYNGGYPDHNDSPDPDIEAANEVRAWSSVMFGWPADGTGMWTSIFSWSRRGVHIAAGSGKINFAINMEERVQVMQECGAEFIEDLSLMKELQEPWSSDVYET
jgi:hypothetical protein